MNPADYTIAWAESELRHSTVSGVYAPQQPGEPPHIYNIRTNRG